MYTLLLLLAYLLQWPFVLELICIQSEQENRFAKCDTCCVLKDEKTKTVDAERRKALQSLLDKHLELQR